MAPQVSTYLCRLEHWCKLIWEPAGFIRAERSEETKLQKGQINLDFPRYEQYWCYADKKGYSGTAIFTKRTPISASYNIGVEEHSHEGRAITLEYEEFYLVCVYTPNAQDELKRLEYRMSWENDFRNYLMSLDKLKPIIVCGDMKESPSGLKQVQKRKPIIVSMSY